MHPSTCTLQRHSICWNVLVLHYSFVTCCEVTAARGNKTPQQRQERTAETHHQSKPFLPSRCRRHPLRCSQCEASRPPRRQTRAPPWPSCSVPTTCARRPTTCRSPTWTCTSATTSTPRTKARGVSRTTRIAHLYHRQRRSFRYCTKILHAGSLYSDQQEDNGRSHATVLQLHHSGLLSIPQSRSEFSEFT